MAADDLHRVANIQQRGDDTVVVFVQTDSFKSGQDVEVSVYLTQGNTYAAHIEKKRIPLPDPDNADVPQLLGGLAGPLPGTTDQLPEEPGDHGRAADGARLRVRAAERAAGTARADRRLIAVGCRLASCVAR